MPQEVPATIDEYIAGRPAGVQPLLRQLRAAITEAAPEATEKISWGMATFVYHGDLVHFAAERRHIGFHPTPSAIERFRDALAGYRCSKGTVQFPYEKPLPIPLIQDMVRFRVAEQAARAQAKQAAKRGGTEPRPQYPMPEDVQDALDREELAGRYGARPPYQRSGYLVWIAGSGKPEIRENRLRQMLDELRAGDVYRGKA